jgi:hypothetical protein
MCETVLKIRFKLEKIIEYDVYKSVCWNSVVDNYSTLAYYERTNSFGQRSSLFMFAAHEISYENE